MGRVREKGSERVVERLVKLFLISSMFSIDFQMVVFFRCPFQVVFSR